MLHGQRSPLLRAATGVLLALACAPVATAESPAATGVESLYDVYQQAVDADPELRGQGFEVEALREDERAQFGRLLPQVSAFSETTRVRRDQVSAGLGGQEDIERTFTREQHGLQIQQALFDLEAWYGHRRQKALVREGEARLQAARQDLVLRVVEAYLKVLSARSGVELSEAEARAIEASFERTEALYEEGMVAITDLEEVRARRDSARAAVIRAEGETRVAREQLAEITGRRADRLAPLRAGRDLPRPVPNDPEQWVEMGLELSPRIQAAREEIDSNRLQARQARSQRYPRVQLVAGYTRLDDLDGTAFGRQLNDASIGVEVNLPLYQGGSVGARASAAEHRRSRALESLEQARRSVAAGVRSAFAGIQSGLSEISALEQAVRSGERSVEAMEAGVMEGTRTAVDLVDAQRDLFASRRDLAQARHKYLENIIALRVNAGRVSDEDMRGLDRLFNPVAPR